MFDEAKILENKLKQMEKDLLQFTDEYEELALEYLNLIMENEDVQSD